MLSTAEQLKTSVIFDELVDRYPTLGSVSGSIKKAYEVCGSAIAQGKKLLVCGNGGSAADADHFAGELLKGFRSKRPLDQNWQRALGSDLASKLQGAIPVIPLTGFNALSTAFANDCDADYLFAQLTLGLGQAGDILIGISTSGNSKNVLAAMQVARTKGMQTIALTGESGGDMKQLADVLINVPESETFKIQELHLPVYHALAARLEERFFEAEVNISA